VAVPGCDGAEARGRKALTGGQGVVRVGDVMGSSFQAGERNLGARRRRAGERGGERTGAMTASLCLNARRAISLSSVPGRWFPDFVFLLATLSPYCSVVT
jgi:hypothetical protein